MYSANYKKPYVATYKEIIIGFLTFTLILVVLYPKDLLQQQVLAEGSNYDLSMLYLRNMLKNDPNNEKLMLTLAKQSLRGEKRDLAYRLLKLLKKSKNLKIRNEAYLLSYKIAKEDYYYLLEDKKEREALSLFKELQELNRYIVTQHIYKNTKQRYKESLFLKQPDLTYKLLQELLNKEPLNISYLKNAYALAMQFHHYQKALQYLQKLIQIDKEKSFYWKKAKYYLLENYFPSKQLLTWLEIEAKNSNYWHEQLALFYLQQKRYKTASKHYMQLFLKASNKEQKEEYWIKAIESLLAGNLLKEAKQLAIKYQKEFIKSKKARLLLLKLFLATNDLKQANKIAKTILYMKLKRQ